jgi:predicted TIM-barrel fold metal-dependent hydrolase
MKQRHIGVHLSEDEMRHVTGAEKTAFPSPVPTQVISNGEYNPLPQTGQQRQVEGLIKEYAETYGRRRGLDRRRFLRSASGMAAAFLAFNKVFGPVWLVSEAEAADPDRADARAKRLSKQFVFDDQTHFVRDDFDKAGLLGLGEYAAKHWNPAMLDPKQGGVPLALQRYKFQNYMKEIFLDSDTKIALLSGAPFDDPSWWLLSNAQIEAARDAVNAVAGSRRMFSHFVFTPGYPGWMDEVERGIAELKPDAWKGYTVGDPLSPTAKGTQWRLDDEKLVYPFYERIVKTGIRNVCIHKGLMPLDYEKSWKDVWQYATVWDVEKAAKDWPQLNFIIYHTALRPFLESPDAELAEFEKTGNIRWSTDVAKLVAEKGLKNVYAEIGTSFATGAVANPRFAAAFVGQLVNMMGAERVVYGSDSVWYGSPQWQIEALRRLEIPDDMMKKMKWKTKLGGPDSPVKRKILGENSARLYKVPIKTALERMTTDQIALMKQQYLAEGIERNNAYYGYVPKPALTRAHPGDATPSV